MTRLQILKYFAVLLIGCAVSLFIFFSINNRTQVRNKAIVDNAVAKSELRLDDELNKINLVIESLGFFFENNVQVSQKNFERFTNPFLQKLSGIRALAWSAKIEESELITGSPLPLITEADSSNNLIVSKPRALHFPVKLLNPLEPLQKAIGFDLYSDSTRRSAIDKTIKTSEIALTGPIRLVIQDNGVPGILALKSVIDTTSKEVKGLVLGVYRMDDFFGKTLASELKVLDLCVYDEHADNALLYTSVSESTELLELEKTATKRRINAADRVWNMHYIPKSQYLSFPHIFESYVVLFLGLLTTFFLTYVAKRRDGHNDRLEARVRLRTAELEASNEMKENLLREIHHRVKNNLQITSSLMNMQKRRLTSKEAIMALQDSQARISAIALTHQKIYQDKDSKAVNLHEYLKDLMEYQKKISPSFSYKISCPEISIDLDQAVPLALIISELVTNAVKHAYPDITKYNELRIDVERLNTDNISLTILDNGKGLPKDFDIENAEGIGFEIIRSLCRQISSQLTYKSTKNGTQFNLIFENKI